MEKPAITFITCCMVIFSNEGVNSGSLVKFFSGIVWGYFVCVKH